MLFVLAMAPHIYACEMDQESADLSAYDHFIKLYKILLGNVSVFMQHTYASHILRVMLEVLAGHRVDPDVIRSKAARREEKGRRQCILI